MKSNTRTAACGVAVCSLVLVACAVRDNGRMEDVASTGAAATTGVGFTGSGALATSGAASRSSDDSSVSVSSTNTVGGSTAPSATSRSSNSTSRAPDTNTSETEATTGLDSDATSAVASGDIPTSDGATNNDTSSPAGGPSPGCGAAQPLRTGLFDIDVDGTNRTYTLDVPEDYDPNTPYRLVFVWHPLGGSAGTVVRQDYDRLRPLSEGTAIFVAPEGLSGMAAGITGQGWYNTDGSDMAFLRAMLAHFTSNLCIDQDRIFSTGFSFGGMMSYAIGCEMADVFRAIAPSSGNSVASGCNQATDHAIAVLGLHGDVDDFVATEGGRTARDLFVERNHCDEQTEPVEPSPCVAYQGCDEGYPVIWCEYPGEHRPWESAPEVIWDFFEQF